jgi:microcystin-dependent protein
MTWLVYIRLRGSVPVPTPEIVNRAGEIVPYYGTEVPEYCLTCGGGSYLKATYPLLWAVLETELVGGVKVFEETATTFNTPDFRGRTLIGYGQGVGLTNRIDPVANIGAETHQLVIAEMPAHTHLEEGLDVGAMTYNGGTNRNAFTIVNQQSGSRGGDGAHNNMQPSRAVRWAIRYA